MRPPIEYRPTKPTERKIAQNKSADLSEISREKTLARVRKFRSKLVYWAVYSLSIDGASPFYIGYTKAPDTRLSSHKSMKNGPVYKYLKTSGGNVQMKILHVFDKQNLAEKQERKLIATLPGLINISNPDKDPIASVTAIRASRAKAMRKYRANVRAKKKAAGK